MTPSILAILLVAACGSPVSEQAAPVTKSSARPRLRTDRAPVRLGGTPGWGTATEIVAMRFCPGDHALVARDASGVVRRYRVEDGAQIAATQDAATDLRGVAIDCRADGTALTIDRNRSPILVDATGFATRPPSSIQADNARFAADGSVWAVDQTGVIAWNGASVSRVIAADHALYNGLGGNGVYIEYAYQSKHDGVWMVRDGARIKLPGKVSDIAMVEAAPDGGVESRSPTR